MFAFERLDAWRRCHELTLVVYRVTSTWPKSEVYGLVSQARRAAVSAEVNIAEGVAKHGPCEFRRFVDISLGSLSELACLLRLARDLGLLTGDQWESVEQARESASKVTWRLHQALSRAKERASKRPTRS